MARPGNAIVAGILEYSYRALSIHMYMVVIQQVSLDCTIYMLGVFVIEVSHLIGTCRYILILCDTTRHVKQC